MAGNMSQNKVAHLMIFRKQTEEKKKKKEIKGKDRASQSKFP